MSFPPTPVVHTKERTNTRTPSFVHFDMLHIIFLLFNRHHRKLLLSAFFTGNFQATARRKMRDLTPLCPRTIHMKLDYFIYHYGRLLIINNRFHFFSLSFSLHRAQFTNTCPLLSDNCGFISKNLILNFYSVRKSPRTGKKYYVI